MRLKFLRTTASQSPEYPFRAGQIIPLERLTPEFRRFVRDGAAEVLPEDDTERAVAPAVRTAEPARKSAR